MRWIILALVLICGCSKDTQTPSGRFKLKDHGSVSIGGLETRRVWTLVDSETGREFLLITGIEGAATVTYIQDAKAEKE